MKLKEIKNWNNEIEKEITEKWKKSELFKFDINSDKKIFSIDTPPPYVNAPIHIGQAVTYCYMDFFARFHRMKGEQVIFSLGLDNNGLPIEMGAEKKFGISAFKVSRDDFIKYCKQLLNEAGDATKDTFSKLGISFTSYKEGNHIGAVYQTDSPEYRKITQATFVELYKKGLIYEDKRINNWDPALQTTIADSEIEYKDLESSFNYIKWKIKETGEEIVIGTTRPELIPSCGMIIFHPNDKRYKHLNGKTAISPIFNKELPIKAHTLANPDKGTGIVMMCSAGDLSDIQFFREQKLKPIISIDKDGTMNKNAGKYAGLKIKDARKKIIEDLKKEKLLVKQEKIIHRTPVSERGGAEIEFIEMPEYYLKQLDFKKEMKKFANELNFYPKSAKKILLDWIDSVSIDWPISRRRFYATPIPLWYAYKDDKKIVALPTDIEYYEPWKQKPKDYFEVFEGNKKIGLVKDFKNLEWKGEERVLDTWMDSSISELFILKYKQNDDFFKKAYPVTLRPQGKEIVRTWLYYTLLRGFLETGKICFRDVWIHQHIVDAKGYKMSKSKGNIIDPLMLLEKYGGEAIRFWAATEGDLSKQDLKCSEDRVAAEKKTLNKLLNISRFVLLFKKPLEKPVLTKLDSLFINYVDYLLDFCYNSYEKYDFHNPSIKLRYFLWNIFASNYIELVKARAYNQDKYFSEEENSSARYTLYYILEKMILMLYPIIPQVSSVIGNELGMDLLDIKWPKTKKINTENLSLIDELIKFNSEVWKKKKELGIALKDSIKGIEIPEKLQDFKKDLITTHKLV